jgi:DNA polymerase V
VDRPDQEPTKAYIAIDLKSFYASVECIERGLDPMNTNLLVADVSRTDKTICLAVSPSLKQYGIPGRARMFEAIQKVKEANQARRNRLPNKAFTGKSHRRDELERDPSLEIDFIAAIPRMSLYMEYSTRIYQIYLRHVSPEDIHVYSIDEVLIDATAYLKNRGMSGYEFTKMLVKEVLSETGITATAGIGTNLYLAKIAMDIVAKRVEADADGVRIAQLDERSYREQLWSHTPITDFWRVGKGYAATLAKHGMYTMGDVAKCSTGPDTAYYNESLLYRLFGVNAELLIDHAWGYEPCTIGDIKSYRPESNSINSGQVLQEPYPYHKAELVAREMADLLVLELVDKGLMTNQIVLTVDYDVENLTRPEIRKAYKGEIVTDFYGRKVPKHAHGSANLEGYSSSTRAIVKAMAELFARIVNPSLLVRRITVVANHVLKEADVPETPKTYEQVSIFDVLDPEEEARRNAEHRESLERERSLRKTVLDIKRRYGKNAILKGMNFEEGATGKDRNRQIGGHKA